MSHALPFVAGLIAAVVNILIARALPQNRAAEFFNLFMAATSALYFGSTLPAGKHRQPGGGNRSGRGAFRAGLCRPVVVTEVHCNRLCGAWSMGPGPRNAGTGRERRTGVSRDLRCL